MGRKKRPAGSHPPAGGYGGYGGSGSGGAAGPPPPGYHPGYGVPPYPGGGSGGGGGGGGGGGKRSRTGEAPADEERYLVKKYRPIVSYRSIDAFARYTKSHRMSDAAYVRLSPAAGYGTPDRPCSCPCGKTRTLSG